MKWIHKTSSARLAALGAFATTLPVAIFLASEAQTSLLLLSCQLGILLGVAIFGLVSIRRLLLGLPAVLRAERTAMVHDVQATLFLQSATPSEALLLRFGGMAIGPDFAAELIRLLTSTRPALVVELGSGVSTVLTALTLCQHGTGRLVSIDHEPEYAADTEARLRYFGVNHLAEVRTAPIRPVDVQEQVWQWYDTEQFNDLREIDVLVVDGPPGWLQAQSRYPALPLLIERLSEKAAILLDDTARQDEQNIITTWLQRWPEFKRLELPCENGATLLLRDRT